MQLAVFRHSSRRLLSVTLKTVLISVVLSYLKWLFSLSVFDVVGV